jgi:large subunit ribosomal protein L27
VRQKGSKYHAGKNVRMGGDSTLYSVANGLVKFQNKMVKKFHGNLKSTRIVNVVPAK